MHVRGTKNVGRAVQTDPTLLRTPRRSRNTRNVGSCWLKRFDKVQILRNNSQQQTTTCNRPVCKRTEQQCWELLANNVTSVCTGPLSKIPGTWLTY